MGAHIDGLGTNRIIIHGVRELYGAEHSIGPDYIEAGSFLTCAAATGGALKILNTGNNKTWQTVLQRSLQKIGLLFSCPDENTVLYQSNGPLSVQCDAGMAIPKIEDGPWPAFPSDLMSAAIVVATQAEGSILFFEKMFESRMYFVDRLIEMGARVVQCDPHRVVVSGPSRLHGSHMTSPDIRAGMAMITAALCAEGTSVIENAQMIDRGYERIDARLTALGASISREDA
jgi:UDP-N-acetylglucosamine 1-carboxyvinyltransferase